MDMAPVDRGTVHANSVSRALHPAQHRRVIRRIVTSDTRYGTGAPIRPRLPTRSLPPLQGPSTVCGPLSHSGRRTPACGLWDFRGTVIDKPIASYESTIA